MGFAISKSSASKHWLCQSEGARNRCGCLWRRPCCPHRHNSNHGGRRDRRCTCRQWGRWCWGQQQPWECPAPAAAIPTTGGSPGGGLPCTQDSRPLSPAPALHAFLLSCRCQLCTTSPHSTPFLYQTPSQKPKLPVVHRSSSGAHLHMAWSRCHCGGSGRLLDCLQDRVVCEWCRRLWGRVTECSRGGAAAGWGRRTQMGWTHPLLTKSR